MPGHLIGSLMPFLGSLEGALVGLYEHFWLVDLVLLATLFALYRARGLAGQEGRPARVLLLLGSGLLLLGLFLNEWTVSWFLSADAVLSLETRLLVGAFDAVMILSGAFLIRYRSSPKLLGLLQASATRKLLPALAGAAFVLVVLFNVEAVYHRIRADVMEREEGAVRASAPDAGTDVEGLLRLGSHADVIATRQALARFVWGSGWSPGESFPDLIEGDIHDARYAELENLQRIDRITVETGFGINSVVYHFIPSQGNGRVVIYHQGHLGDFHRAKHLIGALLEEGYSVLGMAMPLLGMNSRPTVRLQGFGEWKLTAHNQLRFLPVEHGHYLKFFLHPVEVALSYALREFGYDSAHMIGFSGGGWTTTVFAALDPRIQTSYSVAGTVPFFLRIGWKPDEEHMVPEFYGIANYPELYLLASYGEGRAHRQMFNRYDPCCYSGTGEALYEPAVQDRLGRLGRGSFETFLDGSHREHGISPRTVEEILDNLRALP